MAPKLQLAIPIMVPLDTFSEQQKLQQDSLAELNGLTDGLVPLDQSFGDSLISIRLGGNPLDEPLVQKIWKSSNEIRRYLLLWIEIDGQSSMNDAIKNIHMPKDFTEYQKIFLLKNHVISMLKFEENIILLISNIIRPGSLSGAEGFSFINGELFGKTEPFFAEHLFGAVEASKKHKWPTYCYPEVRQVWRWISKSGALVDGVGINALGRAIAALSHLTASNLLERSSIDLLWILLGLEALYSKGNAGLKEQLLGKADAILGSRSENKKAFGAVYDFRSRLVHGNVDIPLRFSEFDAVDRYEKFYSELGKNEDLALAALIATIQWMAKENLTELSFSYSLVTRK